MREIKFRITYQHGETGRITCRYIFLGQPIPDLGRGWSIIGKDQYTGLHDSEGKEIYEGDIVAVSPYRKYAITVDNFHGYRFMWGKGQLYKSVAIDGKIIGTIYENPELIE